jgi:SM-20-related protein
VQRDSLTVPERVKGTDSGDIVDDGLFALIAEDLLARGYSIRPGALPEEISRSLLIHQQGLDPDKYSGAGIGRGNKYVKTDFVRTDEICWITGESYAGALWLQWASRLQNFLNRRLFLGLFSFESHFAHYAPGDYYKRHYDAFRGETNRVLSIVTYLNPGWTGEDSGELVLYTDDCDRSGTKIVPLYGTVVVFLSEEFPHEVLPASRDRYSVAGWFRVNASIDNRVDPPL